MVSEAAATGKPVHIVDLPGGDAKFARFHTAMREAGITRPFAGEIEHWSYRPPDDTARAGAALRDLVAARFSQRTGTRRMKQAGLFAGIWLLLGFLFLLVPAIDLAVTGLFYIPGEGFPLAGWAPLAAVEDTVPWITKLIVGIAAVGAVWLALIGRPLWRLDRKALVFIVAATVLGPGLIANTVLKDHWGRARPSQIEAFGGTRQFTPAPLPAAQCERNCAFVSGHAALAFSLVELRPAAARRPAPTAGDRRRARIWRAGRDRADGRRGAFPVRRRLCRADRVRDELAALRGDRHPRRARRPRRFARLSGRRKRGRGGMPSCRRAVRVAGRRASPCGAPR